MARSAAINNSVYIHKYIYIYKVATVVLVIVGLLTKREFSEWQGGGGGGGGGFVKWI